MVLDGQEDVAPETIQEETTIVSEGTEDNDGTDEIVILRAEIAQLRTELDGCIARVAQLEERQIIAKGPASTGGDEQPRSSHWYFKPVRS